MLADLDTLKTLPPREFRAGYAEVVKYGALGDAAFFRWLEQNAGAVFDHERDHLVYAIGTSCRMKAEIVSRDEREAGDRALLNLGHTFGHAIEAWAGYSGAVLHGEAVALGMALAGQFSFGQGYCGSEAPARLKAHLGECGLPVSFADLRKQAGRAPTLDELMSFMEQDKKVKDGEMTLVLLRGIGDAFIARNVAQVRHPRLSAVAALRRPHSPRHPGNAKGVIRDNALTAPCYGPGKASPFRDDGLGSWCMADASRADGDDGASGDAVRGQPFVQEEAADQRGEHHAGFAESRHRPHRSKRHGEDDGSIGDE